MGLFYKRELPQSSVRYSSGLEQTRLVVGLGNAGPEYVMTRHNAGFICLDAFAAAKDAQWEHKKALQAHITDFKDGNTQVLLIKPTTMMNLSGEAVSAVQRFYKIGNADTLVVHDELDIDFGTLRIRIGGSSAGNNGIKSLIQHIGEDFTHVRIGIGPKKPARMDSADFVLQRFSKKEQDELSVMTQEVGSIITEFVYNGQLLAETRKYIL